MRLPRLPCWMVGHAPILTRTFETPGIVWRCQFCLKHLGQTVLNVTVLPFRPAPPPDVIPFDKPKGP